MRVKFENGTKDVPLTEVTAENYIVPKGEENSYHVIQEMTSFDNKTGKRLSRPVLQKYDAKIWPTQRKALASWGYDLTIVHDPSEYNRQQAEIAQQTAANRQRIIAQQEAQRKAKERAAMKAELMAEIRAELLAEAKAASNKKSNKSNKG